MKCEVCGYKQGYEYDENDDYKEVNPNGKKFIEVEGHFTIESSGYHGGKNEVNLYACPKCKTVQMESF